jgi:hypothetical protein
VELTKKSQTCYRGSCVFFIAVPQESKLSAVHQQKSRVCLRPTWLFFLDKRFEISNQNLARDITLIVELGEIVPSFE